MNTYFARLSHFVLLTTLAGSLTANAESADPGWPRVFKQGGKQLTVYQPQVDYWHGYTNLHFRCAIAVKGVSAQEKFGVAEVDALTIADQGARIVAIVPLKRELRFAGVQEPELTSLRQAAEQLNPPGHVTTLSLDRVIAYLDPAREPVQPAVELNLNPPQIVSSTTPAILLNFMGQPQLQPVAPGRTDLLFAVNINWDVLYDTASKQYFLLNGKGWLTAPDALQGPWVPARTLPASLYSLPADANWAEARGQLPGKPAKVAPIVFATTQPAELILTDGQPSYQPVRGTQLLRVNNTASVLFLDTGDSKFYFLVAGRWFRGGSLNGPWSAASQDLPSDFAQIPSDDPAAFVKASVPGTREAADAVLLASIPSTITVNLTDPPVKVTYSGAPQFVVIPSTTVEYAINTPNSVLLAGGKYYCCDQGVWFVSAAATGPWSFCSSVPQVIYTIPPTCPVYNVTYVVVQSSTPTTVVYSQTAGYSGQYVAATGVLMFGAGMLVGAAIANNNHSYYYPPPPCHYSYGCGATYHYGYGGYYSTGGSAYGPYGSASCSSSYNTANGTYSRSGSAYGAYGSASHSAAYNPYTSSYTSSSQVNSAYGSAGHSTSYNASSGQYSSSSYKSSAYGSASSSATYNTQTGARSASAQASTAYGSAGRSAGYNPTTGQGYAGGYDSGQYGSAGKATTTSGGSAAGYSTANSQGVVAKTSSGDVYASNGDSVYKKDPSGGWSENSGSGWNTVQQPQSSSASSSSSKQAQYSSQSSSYQQPAQSKSSSYPSSSSGSTTSTSSKQSEASSYQQPHSSSGGTSSGSSSWDQQKSSMESQSQARSSGNQQHQSTQSWQSSSSKSSSSYGGHSSGSSSYSGHSYSGGHSGGGRR